MLEIVDDNNTYYLVGTKKNGEKRKMGLNGMPALDFFRQLTDEESKGSTEGIPQLGVFENQLGIDLD